MKRIDLSTGKVVIIGHPGDGFTLATYRPIRAFAVEGKPPALAPQDFRIELPGNVFAIYEGAEADEMLSKLSKLK